MRIVAEVREMYVHDFAPKMKPGRERFVDADAEESRERSDRQLDLVSGPPCPLPAGLILQDLKIKTRRPVARGISQLP